MVTTQQIFDTVVAHLRRQGKQSRIINSYGGPSCRYRHPEDATVRCAAGCLIDDTEYVPEMDDSNTDNSWRSIIRRYPKLGEKFTKEQHLLIQDLQTVHDFCYEGYNGLARVAKRFGLEFDGNNKWIRNNEGVSA